MSPKLDPRLDPNDPIYQYVVKKFPKYSWNYVKNQHFVPVFYQKLFSCGKNALGEDMIRHCNNNGSADINIRDSCKSDFTYGKDCHIEAAYGWSEDRVSKIINNISKNPNNNHFRAEYSRESMIEFMASLDNRSIRTITEQKQFIKICEQIACDYYGITDWTIDTHLSDKPSLFVMLDNSWVLESCYFRHCIIVNKTKKPIITSDCPLCVYNLKYNAINPVPQYDKATEGAIWYLPISPKNAIVMYDSRHYSIDDHNGVLSINKEVQIDNLNKLVACNSYDELLYNSDDWDDYVKGLLKYIPDKANDSECLGTFGRGFYIKESIKINFIKVNDMPIIIQNIHKRHNVVANYFYEIFQQIIENGLKE